MLGVEVEFAQSEPGIARDKVTALIIGVVFYG
jgi:hypothetical protein